MILRLLCLMLLCLGAHARAALDVRPAQFSLGEAAAYLEDTRGELSFDKVRALPALAFTPVGWPVFSRPFTRSSYWFRVPLNNPDAHSLTRLLWLDAPWLHRIDGYLLAADGQLTRFILGNGLPFERRSLPLIPPNQRLVLPPGDSLLYLRVQTPDPFIVSLNLMPERDFLLDQGTRSLHTGLIYGAILCLLLFNLLLFPTAGGRYQLAYVGYLGSFLLMNAAYNNYTFPLLFAQHPDWQDWMQSGAIFAFLITGLVFTRSFLGLAQRHRRLGRLTRRLIWGLLGIALLSPVLGYATHVHLAILLSSLTSSYCCLVGCYSWWRGNGSARFFLLGAASGLLGTLVTALTVMGVLPYSYLGYKALDLGLVLDGVLMSLALADRLKQTREDQLRAQLEATTDSLTGLLNRRAFENQAGELLARAQRGAPLAALALDLDGFKQLNDTQGHLCGDAMLRHVARLIDARRRINDRAYRLGGDEFLILLPDTDEAQASALLQRLQRCFACQPLHYQGQVLPVRLSLGLGQWQRGDGSLAGLLKRADQAMYAHKHQGRSALDSLLPETS
ncbi:diguanylate cyclase [Pseudaeromonas paramecii]|uniref:diguanylate cyclase n=1 Tax=Pseudaeromonas paramecii TaxID=2138166 RepID=A0ABP8QGD1_9GAMM